MLRCGGEKVEIGFALFLNMTSLQSLDTSKTAYLLAQCKFIQALNLQQIQHENLRLLY